MGHQCAGLGSSSHKRGSRAQQVNTRIQRKGKRKQGGQLWASKVGDFGLARFKFDTAASTFVDSSSTSSIALRGTIGYIAPECAVDGQLSTATDVYSFGVILLEIFIRRSPTDDMFKDGMSIAKLAEINLPNNVLQIIDPQLLQELDHNEVDSGTQILQSVLSIGLCCTKTSPNERISMQEVAAKLHGIQEAYLRGY